MDSDTLLNEEDLLRPDPLSLKSEQKKWKELVDDHVNVSVLSRVHYTCIYIMYTCIYIYIYIYI